MIAFLFGPPGMGEMVILAVVGVLIFGKRLPEVGKSLGKGIVEFKRGLAGVKDEIEHAGQPTDGTSESPDATSGQTPLSHTSVNKRSSTPATGDDPQPPAKPRP